MKKTLLILAAFAAAALVSCNKELAEKPVQGTDPTTDTPGGVMSEFSFSVARELPGTKSYLDGNDFLWEDGEEIAVCYGSSVVKFVYSEATEKFSSSEFDESASGPFYVVAPYDADIAIVDGKVSTKIPDLQTAGEHGVDSKALLSVGKADDVSALAGGVSLKNAFSLVKVGITDTDVNRISIDGNYEGTAISPVIAGPVTVDPASGVVTVSGRTTSVSLVPEEGAFAAGDYIIAVAPQTMTNGIKVVFRRAEEARSYYRNSSKNTTFERNKGISFAAVSAAGLTNRCFFITDAADMAEWSASTFVDTDNIFLGADIDMTDATWKPVNNFVGTFDGQNHRVYNLEVTGSEYVGFIRINKNDTSTAVLKNAIFGSKDGESWDGVSIFKHSNSSNNYTWYYVGVFAKTQQSAEMENVTNFAKAEVAAGSTGKTRAAGLCGNWASSKPMKNCYNYGEVVNNADKTGVAESGSSSVATSILGGVVAQCDTSVEIVECENYGTITNKNPYVKWVGGIIGSSSQNLTVKKCINYGTIKNEVAAYTSWLGTGGIAGYLSGASAKIDACQTINASISSVCHVVGGIAAQIGAGTITGCTVSNSNITGSANFPAGILAYCATNGAKVNKCKVTDSTVITGKGEIGGIGGRFNASVTVTDCEFSKSTINASGEDAGGIIGWSQNGVVVEGCKVLDATISSSSNYVSGVVGLAEKTSVLDCIVNDSSISGDIGVGGFAGFAKNAGNFVFNGCIVKGSSIKGRHSIGGIVGYAYGNSGTNILNAYFFNCGTDSATSLIATGSDDTPPAGDSMVAGICGWLRCASTGAFKIVNCYCNAGIVCQQTVNTPSAGGTVGYCSFGSGSAEITNFSTSLTAERIQVGGAAVASGSRYGAICGMLPDKPIEVSKCYYMADKGLDLGSLGESVVVSDCDAVAESTFKDGSTVVGQLNAYVSAYTGSETLKSWTVDASGLPVLVD